MSVPSENGRSSYLAPSPEDDNAIAATLAGDCRAFETLVVKYQRPLYAALRRIVRRHEDADDLLQECFVRAFRHLRDFDRERPFYPWLHRIAVNLAITFLRRQAWQQPTSELDIFPTMEDDPNQIAESSEFFLALERAIHKLPVEQRTVLLLRTHEGMSYQEMSKQLGIEIGTVMSRLARAREKLRSLLRPFLDAKTRKNKMRTS